ncbi:hypothetical protein Q8F55_004648 [Vanrija albida]|uniref:Uncharacterized protein n=1 Tax=Vanrija albida TaxID=181172 RepID=A0ABR3Q7K0_9TREE
MNIDKHKPWVHTAGPKEARPDTPPPVAAVAVTVPNSPTPDTSSLNTGRTILNNMTTGPKDLIDLSGEPTDEGMDDMGTLPSFTQLPSSFTGVIRPKTPSFPLLDTARTPTPSPKGKGTHNTSPRGAQPKPTSHVRPKFLAKATTTSGTLVKIVASKSLARSSSGGLGVNVEAGASTGPRARTVAPPTHHLPSQHADESKEDETGRVVKGKASPGSIHLDNIDVGRPKNAVQHFKNFCRPDSRRELDKWAGENRLDGFDANKAFALLFPHAYLRRIVHDVFPPQSIHHEWGPHLPHIREVAIMLLKDTKKEHRVDLAKQLRRSVSLLGKKPPALHKVACSTCVRHDIPCINDGNGSCFHCGTKGGSRASVCDNHQKGSQTAAKVKTVEDVSAPAAAGHTVAVAEVPETAPKVTAASKPAVAAPKAAAPADVPPETSVPVDQDAEPIRLLSALRWHMVIEEDDDGRRAQAEVLFEWLVESSGINVTANEFDELIAGQSQPRRRAGRPSLPKFTAVTRLQKEGREKRAEAYYQKQADDIAACGKTRSQTTLGKRKGGRRGRGDSDHEGSSDDDFAGPSIRRAKKKARIASKGGAPGK